MVNKPLSLQARNKRDKLIQLNNGGDSLISTVYLRVVDLTGVHLRVCGALYESMKQ